MEAYKYETFVRGVGPSEKLHPQKRIYIPNVGVLSYGLDGDHIDDFSTTQTGISLAQEDIETGSPRAKNIKKIDLPDQLIKQLMSGNERLRNAKNNLERVADSIIEFVEN